MCAIVGKSVAHTGIGTGEVTKVLIVMLRTLAPAIADVCHVQADSGATTAVETRTGGRFALMFVLVMWAVIHTIAEHIQGQTVAGTWKWSTSHNILRGRQ